MTGMVARACNLSYSRVAIGRIKVEGQFRQKVSKTPISCYPSYKGGINWRLMVQAKNTSTFLKNN
jgi:hypothetical protein